MLSAVSSFTACDLQGGPLEICRAYVSCCLSHALLLVDLCRSIALCQQISADSHPFPSLLLGCWSLHVGKYGSGKLFPLITQCDGAS